MTNETRSDNTGMLVWKYHGTTVPNASHTQLTQFICVRKARRGASPELRCFYPVPSLTYDKNTTKSRGYLGDKPRERHGQYNCGECEQHSDLEELTVRRPPESRE